MHFFPTPYENELLYSILVRYCIRSGNIKDIHNIEDIFGKRSCIAIFEFASNLDFLFKNLPYGNELKIEEIINNHTIFPMYAHFLKEETANDILNEMMGEKGDRVYIKLGLISNTVKLNKYMMFCPKCLDENIDLYGESYWDRLHQIPGVFVCYKHKTLLYRSRELIRGGNRQRYIAQSKENCIIENSIVYSKEVLEKMFWMAEDVEKLFNRKIRYKDINFYKNKFRAKLIEKGYARLNNFIFQKKLKSDFVDFYGEEYLNLLNSSVSHKERCWLTDIFYKKEYNSNPIRFLLLGRFLGITVEELLDDNEFEYKDEEYYKFLWNEKISHLAKQEKSIREIAREMNSSTKTIRKTLEELKIKPSQKWNGGGKYVRKNYLETEEYIVKRSEKRKKWIELLNSYPEKSNNKLREMDQTTYRWLIKYDKDWLRQNSSKVKIINITINWDERDRKLLPEVKKTVDDMKSGIPERITWTSIGKKLGISGWLLKRKNKLPKTKEYIESHIENLKEYQMRKVKWAIDELNKQGREVTFWNVVEVSGVKERFLKDIISNDNNFYLL